MFRVVESLVGARDQGLMALACAICVIAAITTVKLLGSRNGIRPPVTRVAVAAFAYGAGAWVTHFVGTLSLNRGVPFGYDVPLTGLAFIAVCAGAAVAFTMRLEPANAETIAVLRGLALAAGTMAMHVLAMHALLLPGMAYYHTGTVLLTQALGVAFTVAGIWLLGRRLLWPSALSLALGIVSMDLLGMSSVSVVGAVGLPLPLVDIAHPVLAGTIVVTCVAIIGIGFGASLLDRHVAASVTLRQTRFRLLADATFEGLILERKGLIIDTNQAMGDLTGLDPADLVGRRLADLMPGIKNLDMTGRKAVELDMRLPDGGMRPVELLCRDAPGNDGHVVAVRDLSRQKAAESMIDRLARLDPLTGLLNRETFEQQVQKTIAQADKKPASVALLHIGIDRFDALSELVGSSTIEQLLIQIAQRLGATVRQSDAVGRLSRDEFAVLQPVPGASIDAAALADRILQEMDHPFQISDHPVPVSINLGIALHPADGTTSRELIRNASLAMRQARQDGKGRWRYFDAAMDAQFRARQTLQRDLRTALKLGQFTLQYQPFYDATTLQIVGYEALLRWDHPDRGRIPPSDFIPVAEEAGLIVPIGNWVLAAACAEAASWRTPAVIAVNLSPVQFERPGIVETVATVLKRTGLSPARLELEITETTLVDDKKNALHILTELKALGVRLAMDDFGTGYSSLSYLRTFPFDKIKIDRSFIRDVERDAEAETIVQAIIAMGMSLRLSVTAEGVETKQQLAMLQVYGCNFVQGYLLSRPRNASVIDGRAEGRESAVPAPAPDLADVVVPGE